MSWNSTRCTRRAGLFRGAGAFAALRLLGGAFAGALGLIGSKEAAAACQRPRQRCERDGDCCRGAVCRAGRCRCRGGFVERGDRCVIATPDQTPPPPAGLCQRIGVPSYFDPWTHWDRAVAGAPDVGFMVLNPNSGVDPKGRQQHWVDITAKAQAAGIAVIGYVLTDDDPRAPGLRPAAEVKAEVDLYFEWYNVDGIYFDVASDKAADVPHYRDLADHVRGRSPGALVALNPGFLPAEGYMDFADIIEVFESSDATYKTDGVTVGHFAPGSWVHNYPAERFFHAVSGVPDRAAFEETLALAKRRNAGYVFITDVSDYVLMYKSLGAYWDDTVAGVCPER